ncbi:unnamed protein product [Camellia sinensis]
MEALKALNLSGVLPRELVKLPRLLEFDISKNYVNGTIPPEWGSLPRIMHIALFGNRITGSIPKELGNITTLESIVLEFNQMSGPLPQELGNLTRLQKLELDVELFLWGVAGNTSKADHFEGFSDRGQPLYRKHTQFRPKLDTSSKFASGLDGPIPSGIAVMTNMTKLRISDLNGTKVSTFPPLNNMRNLQSLILKSCNIIGSLPEYLETMNNLTTLDLSFNKLSGEIPSNFVNPSASISMLFNW